MTSKKQRMLYYALKQELIDFSVRVWEISKALNKDNDDGLFDNDVFDYLDEAKMALFHASIQIGLQVKQDL